MKMTKMQRSMNRRRKNKIINKKKKMRRRRKKKMKRMKNYLNRSWIDFKTNMI
jgi:hypothetical protein